jgi:TonB family protein
MRRWLRSLVPYALSVVIHGVVGVSLAAAALFVARKVMAPEPMQVELVVTPPAVEEPANDDASKMRPQTPPKPDEIRPRRTPRRKVRTLTQVPSPATQPRQVRLASAPLFEPQRSISGEEPIRPGPAAPPVFGISLDSADSGGGTFVVPVGNTLATSPMNRGPVEGRPGRPRGNPIEAQRAKPVEDHRITSWPERVDDQVFRYPEEARREGKEGSVLLRLQIDEQGRVVKAELAQPANPVLDREALANALRLRFSPARAGKKAVPSEIRYTFTFVLD